MLFFKDLVHDKLADENFKQFYDRECHICSITIKLVSWLEKDPEQLTAVLEQSNMTEQQWQSLKSGDQCHPETVRTLCDILGLDAGIDMRHCPRLSKEIN